MKLFTTKHLKEKIAGTLVAAVLLTGCLGVENSTGPDYTGHTGEGKSFSLNMRMGLASVTALRKSSVITLDKMVVTMSSSANDTIRDTITSSTTPALNTVSTTGQTIQKNYNLQALRQWTIIVTTRDALDSVIHRDTAQIPALYAGDTADVSLNLSSKYTMYEAKFLSLPDSIQSSTPAQPKQKLRINRLVLKIDGLTVRDSSASPGYFDSLTTHTLAYDYVAVDSHSVQLIAYGPMNSWDVANPLYSGTTSINVGAGVDSTHALSLSWVGPTTGTGKLDVELGKVGKVTVNGTLPGTMSF